VSTLTRRGALSACLPGPRQTGADRAIVVHTDTIGGMVKRLKENGRLELKPIGTHSARFAEGAHVRIFTDDLDRVITGQVLRRAIWPTSRRWPSSRRRRRARARARSAWTDGPRIPSAR
jgi:putative aminopeptidase FrvX